MADSKDPLPEFEEPELPANGTEAAGPLEELDFTEPIDFSFPSDAMTEAQPAGEAEPLAEAEATAAEAEAIGDLGLTDDEATGEPAEAEVFDADEVVAEVEAEAEPSRGKKLAKWLARVEWIAVPAVVVTIWMAAGLITSHAILSAAYMVLLLLIPYSLWKLHRFWTSPQITAVYTLMLAVGTAALLTAVYWLGLELARYDWDIKARKAKELAGAVQLGLPSTMAAAWPAGIQVTASAEAADDDIGSPWTTEIGQSGSGCS